MDQELIIEFGSAEDIPSLRELWLGLHQRHQEAMPELAPYATDEESWMVRSAMYASVLTRPRAVLLLAKRRSGLVGYAVGFVLSAEEKAWLDDTWTNTGDVGEVESLGVLPNWRGAGIGSQLLNRLEAELLALGAKDLVLAVLPGNEAAIRLYARFGYRPTWMYLSKLEGRR